MLSEAGEKFKLESAKHRGPEYLYARYLEITGDYPYKPGPNAIGYLEAFMQYSPSRCIRARWHISRKCFTLDDWGDEYLFLLAVIAAYYLDSGDHKKGMMWACKAVSVLEYLLPTINRTKSMEFTRKLCAYDLICFFPSLFHSVADYPFILKWELEESIYFANDNESKL